MHDGDSAADFVRLTAREREIALLIIIGYGDEEIATRLSISFGEAARRRRELFEKLGVPDRLSFNFYAGWFIGMVCPEVESDGTDL